MWWTPTITSQALPVRSWSVLSFSLIETWLMRNFAQLRSEEGPPSLAQLLLQVEAASVRTDSCPVMPLTPVGLLVSCPQASLCGIRGTQTGCSNLQHLSKAPSRRCGQSSLCHLFCGPSPGRPTWLLLEKAYKASGFSRWLMKLMASSRLFTVTRGRMGPKISSCITGSDSCTSANTVGAVDKGRNSLAFSQGLVETRLQTGETKDLTSQNSRV